MVVLAWIVFGLAFIAAILAIPWLCVQFSRSFVHHWRSARGGGGAFSPLQELVQPQIRHVEQVREQRQQEDEEGAPPP
jgi:hypothetical protein